MSICEAGGNGSEELKKCPPPSPAVLWFVNICERKPIYISIYIYIHIYIFIYIYVYIYTYMYIDR